jgi:hypothetical protein
MADVNRSGQGQYERGPEHAERDAQAARLRAEGKTYTQIANTLGWSHASVARRAVQRALVAVVQEAGDELRTLELERLNLLLDKAWQVMERVHFAHSAGRLITINGAPVEDSGPTLNAMDRILKVMERRAKLLGLDAPVKHEHMTLDVIDAEIARLEREHAAAAVVGGSAAGTAPPAS